MSSLGDRLADLRRHIEHLRGLDGRVRSAEDLSADFTLHNDVLFSLLTVSQVVIDVAGELSARRGLRFQDYTEAVRNLGQMEGFPPDLVRSLERLPGFRNVLIHAYTTLDLERAVATVHDLEPVETFVRIVARMAGGARG